MQFNKEKSDQIAQDLLGFVFKMGARGENNEMDCYGVIVYYYGRFGIKMPDYCTEEDWDQKEEIYLRDYASMMRKLKDGEEPEIGDMILFRNVEGSANHAAVYLGTNRFLHSYRKIGTKIDSLTNKVWKEKVYAFFRLKD